MEHMVETSTSLVCPRCGHPADGRFYGPCTRCREELVARYESTTGDPDQPAESARFEPKMNVVPNQVAIKD